MNKRDYYPCETCTHEEVCQYKKYFYVAQEYVDVSEMPLTIGMTVGMTVTSEPQDIHDLPFVQSINVICKYYSLSSRALSEKLSTTTTNLEVPQ